MANTILTAKQIADVSVGLLTRTLVLPGTCARIPGEDFAGSNGDTVTVRVPQPGTARVQSTPGADITYDDITEVPVDVTVRHLYHGALVTDEDLTLKIEDFAEQVTAVQVDAVATGAEDELGTAMNDLAADVADVTETNVAKRVLEARTALSDNNVPASDRYLAVAPDFAEMLLDLDNLSFADHAASDTALREAIVGRYRGFTVVESNSLDAGTAVAYHRTGFVFANRVPVRPRGANDSATTMRGGIGLRHIFQYEAGKLSDASVLSTFAGASLVDADRVYKLSASSS